MIDASSDDDESMVRWWEIVDKSVKGRTPVNTGGEGGGVNFAKSCRFFKKEGDFQYIEWQKSEKHVKNVPGTLFFFEHPPQREWGGGVNKLGGIV